MPATLATKKGKPTYKEAAFSRAFVREKGNSTEAAAQTYDVGSRHSAESIGSENLRKERVQLEIARVLAKVDIDKVDERTIAANIAEIALDSEYTPKTREKYLEMLGKWRAMFVEKAVNLHVHVVKKAETLTEASAAELLKELSSRLLASNRGETVDVVADAVTVEQS